MRHMKPKEAVKTQKGTDAELLKAAQALVDEQVEAHQEAFGHYPKLIVRIMGGVSKKELDFFGNFIGQTFIKQGSWYRPFPATSCPQLHPLQRLLGIILLDCEGVEYEEESLN